MCCKHTKTSASTETGPLTIIQNEPIFFSTMKTKELYQSANLNYTMYACISLFILTVSCGTETMVASYSSRDFYVHLFCNVYDQFYNYLST